MIKREDEARVRDIMAGLGYPAPLQVKRVDSGENREKNRHSSWHRADKSELQEHVRLHYLSAYDLEFMEVGQEKEHVANHRLELDYAGQLDDFEDSDDYDDDEDYFDDDRLF